MARTGAWSVLLMTAAVFGLACSGGPDSGEVVSLPPAGEGVGGTLSTEESLARLARDLEVARREGGAHPEEGGPGKDRHPSGQEESGGYRENPMRGMKEAVRAEIRRSEGLRLRELMKRHEAADTPEARTTLMEEISPIFRSYGAAGGDLEPLAFLERVARGGAARRERNCAVIAVHTLWQREVVDYLLRMAELPDESVRFYAVEGLAWVTGEERPRAVERLVTGMDDAVANIRGSAALALAIVVGDAAHVPDILSRLARESDPATAKHMAFAILKLDPGGGRARIGTAMESAPEENRRLVEGIVRNM